MLPHFSPGTYLAQPPTDTTMFGIFKKDLAPQSPLKDDRRKWLEESFHWLTTSFQHQSLLRRKVLTPHHSDFPIRYNGDPQTAADTLDILAAQMEIAPDDIILEFYDDTINQISTGSPTGTKLSLASFSSADQPTEPSETPSYSRNAAGKYSITLKKSHLQRPEHLVAVLTRELTCIRLLGEGRITTTDEALIDLTTVVFGLGIFNANAAFNSQELRITGKNARLTQMEWGYGLALFAHLRSEKKPAWIEHLVRNIRSDFLKSEQYIAYHHPQ
ncbi:hypothetical protein [Puia sp.]|uniref:hypothetical protein n=1 Tax=Puia sp. TaxID=2045100 RepID=UPI002F40807B